jgi:CRISPR-associated protein Cst2
MNEKAVVATWLFKTDLSNMNAGEGSTNLKELKTYKNGLPYISGQSVRHALRAAIQRENPNGIKCTPEFPCGNIKDCWLCDLFGYLLPGEGAKRWSPIKASPAMGQIRNSITTDMILRLVNDIECPHCHEKMNPLFGREAGKKEIEQGKTDLTCPKCSKQFKAPYDIRQAIAYKQLTDNIYRVSIAIDINALGKEETPIIEGEGESAKINGIKYKDHYSEIPKESDIERKKRVAFILNAIANMSDFASQSREMTNASPDAILISVQGQYNHRLSSALVLDEEGTIDCNSIKAIIKDTLEIPNTKIYAGIIPGIIKNQPKLLEIFQELDKEKKGFTLCATPVKAVIAVMGLFK